MSPEEKELLKRSVSLGEENNKILRSMKRSQRISQFMSFLYWVLIIGSAAGVYYFIQPYVDQIKSVYGGASDILKQ
jgi:TRAP-type C4-dicarboxylate transport system permease small subunit